MSSREIRVNPKPTFEAAKDGEEVVITSRGKPVALLVGGENLEETLRLLRRAKPHAAVTSMRGAAIEALRDHLARQMREIGDEYEDKGLVFASQTGKTISDRGGDGGDLYLNPTVGLGVCEWSSAERCTDPR